MNGSWCSHEQRARRSRCYVCSAPDIPPDRSRPCVSAPVDLWAARPIDPAKPLTWNNSKNLWLGDGPIATATDNICAGRLEFAGDALTKLVQQAADKKTGFVTVGLRAHDESIAGTALKPNDRNYPTGMLINYNNPPIAADLSTVPVRPCGAAAAPTPLTSGTANHFAARVTDPDGDNVIVRLEVLRADGSVAHASEVGPVTSGSSFSWPNLPAGTLTDGPVYRYHAQARDDLDIGPSTPDCYFTVDSVAPHTPTITSTDFPQDGEPAILARTTGTVTLHLAGGDTDVAAFRWGNSQDRVTHRINVGPDGTAVLPQTVLDISGRLWVRAVDRAGNVSPVSQSWDLPVFDNPSPPAHVRGDVTGDGRPDVSMVVDNGRVWTFVAKDNGFYRGTVGFDPDLPADGPYARGDIDGDGTTDMVYARKNDLVKLISDGNGYGASILASAAKPDRMVAGDFTGDGKADVALQYPGQISVLSNGVVTTWLSATADGLVAGDFDGDGRADIATFGGDKLTIYHSTGSAFESTSDGVARVDAASAVTGDVDGDGRDDVIAVSGRGVTVFGSAAKFAPRQWSSFDATGAVLSIGDFDLDGKADLAVVKGTGQTELWTPRSTGSAFADPVLGGREETGGTPLHVGT